MKSLHDSIKEISCIPPEYDSVISYGGAVDYHKDGYKLGHGEAIKAAAELALTADSRIEELEKVLRAALTNLEDVQGLHAEIMPILMHSSREGLMLADKLNKGYPERSRTVTLLEKLLGGYK